MKKNTKEVKIEDKIARIQDITRILDSDDVQLDNAVGLFEEAMGLLKECHSLLATAEGKIIDITKSFSEIAVKTDEME